MGPRHPNRILKWPTTGYQNSSLVHSLPVMSSCLCLVISLVLSCLCLGAVLSSLPCCVLELFSAFTLLHSCHCLGAFLALPCLELLLVCIALLQSGPCLGAILLLSWYGIVFSFPWYSPFMGNPVLTLSNSAFALTRCICLGKVLSFFVLSYLIQSLSFLVTFPVSMSGLFLSLSLPICRPDDYA